MTVSLTYYVCNEPTHFSASGYDQLRKYVRCIIVVSYFAYAYLIFVLLDQEQRQSPPLTCDNLQNKSCLLQTGENKKIRRMARRFLWE